MKIAYLGTKGLPAKGGIEGVLDATVKRLVGKHEITIYCDAEYTPARTTLPGVRLIRFPSVPGKFTHPTILYVLYALHALLFGKYDFIHMHGLDACFTLPLLRLRYKVIATSHGSGTRVQREKWGKIGRFLLRQNEYPFCYLSNVKTSVSDADAAFYQSHYHTHVHYIPNGVDQDISYDLDAARAELARYNVQPGNYLLFAAGRIDPSKGCHLVIEALKEIKSEVPLLVVGNLAHAPAYAVALRESAANQPVHFLPLITDKKLLYGIVKLCHLFIFPSITEAMSMMLLEVASLGVPIVCSDITENKAAIQENTLYFQSGDAHDLANQVQWALDHYTTMEEMAQTAKETLLQTLCWDRIVLEYEQLYEQLLS